MVFSLVVGCCQAVLECLGLFLGSFFTAVFGCFKGIVISLPGCFGRLTMCCCTVARLFLLVTRVLLMCTSWLHGSVRQLLDVSLTKTKIYVNILEDIMG